MLHHLNVVAKRSWRISYPEYRRVVWHWRRSRLLLLRRLLDSEIFHIASAEDNVFVYAIRWPNLVGEITASAFCAIGFNILERNRGVFGVDLN